MFKRITQRTILVCGILIILFYTSKSYSQVLKKPNGGLKQNDLSIVNWNPPSSLSSHVGYGEQRYSYPYFYFNLNLGYLRVFTKAKPLQENETYTINNRYPFIIEIKPFDLAAFLSSGSSYSIYTEKNEWLRNFTIIFGDKSFSSTLYINSFMLWYGDFMINGLLNNSNNVFVLKTNNYSSNGPPNSGASGILDALTPYTNNFNIGLSDRFHVYRTSQFALGALIYFEFTIPKSNLEVLKNVDSKQSQLGSAYSYYKSNSYDSRLTFSIMGGLFLRYKNNNIELNSEVLFNHRNGNFDGWIIKFQQNIVSFFNELSFKKQFYLTFRYHLLHWYNKFYDDDFYFHHLDLGGEVRGFGRNMHWLGVGLNFTIDIWRQSLRKWGGFDAKMDFFGIIPSVQFYPLAFHGKNDQLKFSIITGFLKAKSSSAGYENPNSSYRSTQNQAGWNYSIMIKVDYLIN